MKSILNKATYHSLVVSLSAPSQMPKMVPLTWNICEHFFIQSTILISLEQKQFVSKHRIIWWVVLSRHLNGFVNSEISQMNMDTEFTWMLLEDSMPQLTLEVRIILMQHSYIFSFSLDKRTLRICRFGFNLYFKRPRSTCWITLMLRCRNYQESTSSQKSTWWWYATSWYYRCRM